MLRLTCALVILGFAAPALAQIRDIEKEGGGLLPRAVVALLDRADINRDGDVTRQELKDYRALEFPRLDSTQDGYISEADKPKVLGQRMTEGVPENFIEAFDANGDGKVTRPEYDAGPTEIFDKIDKDHDGIASRYEITAARAAFKLL